MAFRMTPALHLLPTGASLFADVNDWNPTGLGDAPVLRVDTFAASAPTVTGLAGGTEGRLLLLVCRVGALVLSNENGGSLQANRFRLSSSAITLTPMASPGILLLYTGGRWRQLAHDS